MNNPRDFLSEIGIRWQESLPPAIKQGISVTTLRLGVVLKRGQRVIEKAAIKLSDRNGKCIGRWHTNYF